MKKISGRYIYEKIPLVNSILLVCPKVHYKFTIFPQKVLSLYPDRKFSRNINQNLLLNPNSFYRNINQNLLQNPNSPRNPSMKNILKRFHIGTNHDPNRSNEIPSSSSSSPSPLPSCGADHRSTAPTAVTSPTSPMRSPSAPTPTGVAERKDYFSSEEEYQIQLAMAISASNSDFRDDPDSDQIRAATLLSLGTHRGNSGGEEVGAAEALSRRYWVS